jgi:hypothetical protein
VAWIERLSDLPDDSRQLIADEMASREFMPVIQRIHTFPALPPPAPGIWKPTGAAPAWS